MLSGLKAQRQLAVYVALGLSTGGGLWFSAPPAYAADVVVGVGEDQSGDVSGGATDNNTVTIGAKDGGDHPVIGGHVVGGTSANATGNVVTVNSIKLSRSDGTIYCHGDGIEEYSHIQRRQCNFADRWNDLGGIGQC